MPLFESVADRNTGAIQIAEWEIHVKEGRPVGVCQDCGCDLFGRPREIDWGRVYRETYCNKGHERVIPGPYYKGKIAPRPDVLFQPRHLRALPD